MAYDYDKLRWDELASISDFCATLNDDQWDASSLCDGWRVRDVIAHMSLGYTTPMGSMLAKLGRYGFNVPKASKSESIAFASSRSPKELLAVFDSAARNHTRKGISRVIKTSEGLLDHVVHHQDIRRPLGQPRTIPEERLLAALEVAPKISGFVGSKKRSADLRLVASDVDWSHGQGPEVRGSGEALLLTLTGRSAAIDELDGEGVATLKQRLAR
jgi:uncharacterized protein (TIGR03083 family)